MSDSSSQLLIHDGQVPDAIEPELWNKTNITVTFKVKILSYCLHETEKK